MKLSSVNTLALAAFLQVAHADFALMAQGVGGDGLGGNAWGWQVYDDVPKCGHTTDWIWGVEKDVSGGKYGVRCKGSGCSPSSDPASIEELEMNFNTDALHFTIYANRDWGLYDLHDNSVGHCSPISNGPSYYCGNSVGQTVGQYKFQCVTGTTAEEIKKHHA